MDKTEIAFEFTVELLKAGNIAFERRESNETALDFNKKTAATLAEIYNSILESIHS